MFYQWFSFKKQSHLLSNLDSFFLTMVLSRHVLSYRIPWCYRTMSQSYLSPWCYRTMASSYLILFLTHPTFVIVPWNIYHTKIYCKWTSLFDRAYRANLRPEKVIYSHLSMVFGSSRPVVSCLLLHIIFPVKWGK